MKNNSVGCLIAAIVLIVLALIGGAVSLLFWNTKRVEFEESAEVARSERPASLFAEDGGSEEGALVLQRDELRKLPAPTAGEEITREHVLSYFIDQDATDLSREAFREVGEGAAVSWLLQTDNISDRNGVLHARFSLPWQLREHNSTTSSTIHLDAEFGEESRADLIKLRRGDWVTVAGTLSFESGNTVVIKGARLVGNAK